VKRLRLRAFIVGIVGVTRKALGVCEELFNGPGRIITEHDGRLSEIGLFHNCR